MNPISEKTIELLTCDKPSRNGYIYPKEELQKAIDKYQEKIDAGEAFGTLGLNPSGVMDLESVSHKVTEIYFEDNKVIAKIEILDTPSGNSAMKMFDGLSLSSIGYGKLNDENEINDYDLYGTYFSMDCSDES